MDRKMKIKKNSIILILSIFAVSASVWGDPLPTRRADGRASPPPPDYTAAPLAVEKIPIPRPLGTRSFDPGLVAGGRVAVVVETALYPSIATGVSSYVADLVTQGFDPFVITFSGDALQLRTLLQGYYAEQDSLSGVVLVGNLPYVIWEMIKEFESGHGFYEAEICDFYFMDLDGVWMDANTNAPFAAGCYDARAGDLYCEIWVARIAADNLAIGTYSTVDLLNNYFSRNHAYRSGSVSVSKAALHYTDTDWAANADNDVHELQAVFPSVTSRVVGRDFGTGGVDYRDNYLNADYELIQVRCHGTATTHQWDDGVTVRPTDYLSRDPRAVFYNIYGCSSANFTVANCFNRITVMNPQAGGLVSWSHSGTGGMISFNNYRASVFYNALSSGKCVGEAFRLWYNSCVKVDKIYYEKYWRTPLWFNGMRIDGDACLTLRTPIIRYVSKSGSDISPYTTEATAARSVNDAFDVAGTGDIIKIAAGRYQLSGTLIMDASKELKLIGTALNTEVILDGSTISPRDRCVQVYRDVNSVIENLTLTGGNSEWGGINSPGYGGAARLKGGTLRNCVVVSNTASVGGGLYLDGATCVENCLISANTATGSGGGFISYDSRVVISDSVISNNIAGDGGGGGITTDGGRYERCVFTDNTAGGNGGGLYMVDTDTRVLNCVVKNNQSGGNGGGLYAPRGTAISVLVAGNHATGNGGGVYADGYLIRAGLTNLTITANTSDGHADGLYIGSDIDMLNCIIYGNGDDDIDWNGETNQTRISYSCLGESFSGPGTSNLVANSGFVGGGDYSLQSNSICVNAGLTVSWMTKGAVDLPGNPRITEGVVDMGAYEYINTSGMIPASWLARFGLSPSEPPGGNPDHDPFTTREEYIADTNPVDSNEYFRTTLMSEVPAKIDFISSSNRLYTLYGCTNLISGVWTNVPGVPPRMGKGGADFVIVTNNLPLEFYRIKVKLP